MDRVREALGHIKSAINIELKGLKKLRGSKLDTFIDVFNLPPDIELYYNTYNILFIDSELHDNLKSYFKRDSLVFSIEIPDHNTRIWVYQYFNDQIFESYLEDSVKIEGQ